MDDVNHFVSESRFDIVRIGKILKEMFKYLSDYDTSNTVMNRWFKRLEYL